MTTDADTRDNEISTFIAEARAHVSESRERADRAELSLKELEKRVRALGVRGTRDVAKEAAAVAPGRVRETLADKIETALRQKILTPAELAAAVGSPEESVRRAVRNLPEVVDVGVAGEPALSWVIGDETSAGDLLELVVRLVRHRPMLFSEVIRFTGAREKRCSGAIVAIQRDPKLSKKFVNKGERRRALWFLKK